MATALLGKYCGLLALVFLLYSCCCAFRIRDAGSPSDLSRATCHSAVSGKCSDKSSATIAATSGTTIPSLQRKFDGVTSQPAKSHKPPAVLRSDNGDDENDDDDEDDDNENDVDADATVTSSRSRFDRITGYARITTTSGLPSKGFHKIRKRIEDTEEDESEEEMLTIESRPADYDDDDDESEGKDEKVASKRKENTRNNDDGNNKDDESQDKDGSKDRVEDEDEDDENGDDGDDGDDDDDDEDEDDDDDDDDDDEHDEDEDEDHEDEDESENESDDNKSTVGTKVAKVISVRHAEERNEETDDKFKIQEKQVKKPSARNDEKDNLKEEGRKVTSKQDSMKTKRNKPLEKAAESEREEDVSDDEDENGGEKPIPVQRKLEKVRHADKDKYKSAEISPKEPVAFKQKAESKKLTENLETPEEVKERQLPKPKVIQIETESAKPKVSTAKTKPKEVEPKDPKKMSKKEEGQTSVKTDVSRKLPKSSDAIKKPDKMRIKAVEGKSTIKKPKAVSSNANDTKSRQKKSAVSSISLIELNDAILHVSTFVPNFTAVDNSVCQQHGKIFLRQLRGYRLWALQMLDATAKVPSGLLRGNINQLGDFDECLGIAARVKVYEKTVKIQGKYCLANIDLHGSDPDMKLPVNLMQARAFIRSHIRDPEHFIPRYTTVNWALCLPAACSAADAEKALTDGLSRYNVSAGLRFTVNVEPSMCYVKQHSQSYSKETIGVLYFYAMIICLVIVATVRDYLLVLPGKGNYSERIIMSFSLRKTMKTLFKYEESNRGEITCIHGIRAVATIALYIAHQLIPISKLPFANRASLTEVANNPLSSVLRVSLVYTDCFLLLSGVLTAYHMTKELKTRGEIRWFCRSIARFIRLTPALLVIVFWYAFIMEHTGSGPMWNSVITTNADLCKKNAWTNLLYVQNFFPFEEMCATHTHQLALDMQLSLLVPILVFFLYTKPVIGILVIFFIVLLSATLRYVATINNYLSLVIFHGMSVKQLYKTANLTYVLPLHRATPYVFGVGLGVLLTYTGKNLKIHKIFVIMGWLTAVSLGTWSLFSPWRLARRDYVYDAEEATHYAVIGPISWALFLSWTIFACFTDHGGMVNRILSNYWLIIFSRISYAVYLTQFAVFFHNVGTTRYSTEFQVHRAVDPYEAATVIAVSIILTLLFDLPMQEVKNVVMESTDGLMVESAAENETEHDAKDNEEGTVKNSKDHEKVFDEDEVASTGWDWQKDITEGNVRRRHRLEDEESPGVPNHEELNTRRWSFIGGDLHEDEGIPAWDRLKDQRLSRGEVKFAERLRKSRNSQRWYSHDSEEEDVSHGELYRDDKYTKTRISDGGKRASKIENDNRSEYSRRLDNGEVSKQLRRLETGGRIYGRDLDDPHSWEAIRTERASSRGPDSNRSLGKTEAESEKQMKGPLAKSVESRKTFSSCSDEETVPQRRSERRTYSSVETGISDEEGWEEELRIRRRQFREKLASQEREYTGVGEDLRRRSSAEGKIALLKEPTDTVNMDSWTVSRVPHSSHLGSSQEPSEPEDEDSYERRDYRESAPPFRDETQSEEESSWDNSRRRSYTTGSQVTSIDDEEDVSTYDFVLRKESKRISFQDLSKLSQEESELESSGWNLVKPEGTDSSSKSASLGLFKRESIIKSQASEEDPEYILPERPKLVEQEQEHPFKKAWQMQKSRSEEDYSVKESKQQSETSKKEEESRSKEPDASGELTTNEVDVVEEENDLIFTCQDSKSSNERDSNTRSTDERSSDTDDNRQSPVCGTDEDFSRFDWPTEEEQFQAYKREHRMSLEECIWDMGQEET